MKIVTIYNIKKNDPEVLFALRYIYTQRPQSRSMAVRRNDNLVIDATAIFIMRIYLPVLVL